MSAATSTFDREGQQDWWNEIGAEEQEAIDKALAEMKEGKVTPHAEVMKKYVKHPRS